MKVARESDRKRTHADSSRSPAPDPAFSSQAVRTKMTTNERRKQLKHKYLACLQARSPRSLRKSVKALIRAGVRRDLLVVWAIAEGHERKYIVKLLSECFCALGLRQRKKGAGRS